MMLCGSLPSSSTLPRFILTTHKPPPYTSRDVRNIEGILQLGHQKASRRGISMVTGAVPSATSYIFAFVFPLSLLAVTIVTSVRIADKLDEKFLEELAMNQAILEAEENDDDGDKDGEADISSAKEPPTPMRSRNRPKREVEPSSMQ